MPPVCCGRPAIRRPTPGSELAPVSAPALTPVAPLINNLFQKFMQTFIEKAQALTVPTAPIDWTLDIEARDDTDRLFKPQKSDLYYGNLHMKCYYFFQQYEDYFEVTRSPGHKRVLFAMGFLKDRFVNRWQQYKTGMQRNQPCPYDLRQV